MGSPRNESRLDECINLPGLILRKYHHVFLESASRNDSEAYDDLVADGLLLLVRLHKRLPPNVGPDQFRSHAFGHLMLYYKGRYRKYRGIYRHHRHKTDKLREGAGSFPVSLDGVQEFLGRRDDSIDLWIEAEALNRR